MQLYVTMMSGSRVPFQRGCLYPRSVSPGNKSGQILRRKMPDTMVTTLSDRVADGIVRQIAFNPRTPRSTSKRNKSTSACVLVQTTRRRSIGSIVFCIERRNTRAYVRSGRDFGRRPGVHIHHQTGCSEPSIMVA